MFLRFGAVFESAQLLTNSLSSAEQAVQWVTENGHPYSRLAHDDASNNDYVFYGVELQERAGGARLGLGHAQPRPVRRPRHAPGDQPVRDHPGQRRQVLHRQLRLPAVRAAVALVGVLASSSGVDYGGAFGGTTAMPPYRQFFGGGPDTVRGFRESRLGPKDQFGNPYGGNLKHHQPDRAHLPDAGQVGADRARQRCSSTSAGSTRPAASCSSSARTASRRRTTASRAPWSCAARPASPCSGSPRSGSSGSATACR